MTEYVSADLDTPGVRDYLKRRWPNFRPSRHSPETMIVRLNELGGDGWELVHMEPVTVDVDGEVLAHIGGLSGLDQYSSVFFCVLKRRKQA